jgi:hypothetical protein
MSMQGRGISSSSMIWTVFSSMKRPPHSQAATMFWLSCVCGPADGPMGVPAAAAPVAEEVGVGVGRIGARRVEKRLVNPEDRIGRLVFLQDAFEQRAKRLGPQQVRHASLLYSV